MIAWRERRQNLLVGIIFLPTTFKLVLGTNPGAGQTLSSEKGDRKLVVQMAEVLPCISFASSN